MINQLFEKDNSVVVVIENPNSEERRLIQRLIELERNQREADPNRNRANLFANFRSVKAASLPTASISDSSQQDNESQNELEEFEEFEEFEEITSLDGPGGDVLERE